MIYNSILVIYFTIICLACKPSKISTPEEESATPSPSETPTAQTPMATTNNSDPASQSEQKSTEIDSQSSPPSVYNLAPPFTDIPPRMIENTSQCLDLDDRCARWALKLECHKNPNYMFQSCKDSCFQNCPSAIAIAPEIAALNQARKDFYGHVSRHEGLYILSSNQVSYKVHDRVFDILKKLLKNSDPQIMGFITNNYLPIGIVGIDEQIMDLPENKRILKPQVCNADCQSMTAEDYWNFQTRFFYAQSTGGLSSFGEENIRNAETDRYRGESIAIRVFAQLIFLAQSQISETFTDQLTQLYQSATNAGLWEGTFAASTPTDYFSETVQSYFDANQAAGLSRHNDVRTRQQLAEYDPAMFQFLDQLFGNNDFKWDSTPFSE